MNTTNDQLCLLLSTLEENAKAKRHALCWGFFEVVRNGNVLKARCVICNKNGDVKGIYKHEKNSGTNNLIRHINSEHLSLWNDLQQHQNGSNWNHNCGIDNLKRGRSSGVEEEPKYGKKAMKQTQFLWKLASLIGGCHLPLSTCDSNEFKELIHLLDPRITIPSRRTLTEKIIPKLVVEIKESVIQPAFDSCISGCLLYDLWMTRKGTDTIGLMWCCISSDFEAKEEYIGLIEASNTTGETLANEIIVKMEHARLHDKIVGIVRDGAANLRCATNILDRGLVCPLSASNMESDRHPLFETICLAHQINLCCSAAMKCDASISRSKAAMSKVVTWTRKSGKGTVMLRQAQDATNSKKVKLVAAVATRFASTLAMFKSVLENKAAIIHLYTMLVPNETRLPSDMDWRVVRLVYDTCKPIMEALLKAESSGRTCLLSTMLLEIIELYISFRLDPLNEACNFRNQLHNVGEEIPQEQLEQLVTINSKLRSSILGSLQNILQPFAEYQQRTSHYWLSLSIDPRTKRLGILRRLEDADGQFGATQLLSIFEEKALFPLLKTCYMNNNLIDVEELENEDQAWVDDFPQYQIVSRIEDEVMFNVTQEYRSFRRMKDINSLHCPLQWYRLYEKRFPTLATLARHIFSLLPSQASVERLFSVAGHIASCRRSRLTTENLENLIFASSSAHEDVFHGHLSDVDSFLDGEISLLDSCLEELETNEE